MASSTAKTSAEARELIELLELEPLPGEGGYFRRTYCSSETIPAAELPGRYAADHPFGSAILYLLTPETCSALHRLPTDEVYHFYRGDPVEMLRLGPDGGSEVVTLGPDLKAGHRVQVVVPAGVWQGSRLIPGGEYALLGTTMAPGFDWPDLEMAEIEPLAAAYPDRAGLIRGLAPSRLP